MLLPSTRQLDAFLHVARLGSFRRAAEAMNLSQPALSQSIVQLENQLGTPLLSRSTRAVRPTDAGALLLRRLDRILPELHAAVAEIREIGEIANSQLRVGCVPSAALRFLPSVIGSYRRANPKVRILVVDGTADRLHDAVLHDEVDFALSSSAPGLDPDLKFEPAFTDRFRAILRRDHPLAAQETVTWDQLFAYDFLGFAFGSGTRHALDLAFAEAQSVRRPIMELTQLGTVLGMVEANLGVGALPEICCPPADHPVLCTLPLIAPPVKREIGFVTRRSTPPTGPGAAFHRLLVAEIAASGASLDS